MKKYKVIGIMSGTSLDGIDLAYCAFKLGSERGSGKNWNFEILKAKTIEYNKEWKSRLENLHRADALALVKTHTDLGKYFGTLVKRFISENKLKPHLISSHGHTVFHQPENGFTSQIGDGAQIAAVTGIETVCDFRTIDVALGGQGAPLVPAGDQLLFGEYDFCLNLGGIANISFRENKKRIAFDICPVNMALNKLAAEAKINFDKDGKLAAKGTVNHVLFDKLNALDYYEKTPPKSIGKEWFIIYFEQMISNTSIPLNDRLRTVCEHIAMQIATAIPGKNKSKKQLLITGGGTHNKFLVHCIKDILKKNPSLKKISIEIPSKKIIDFKEALIFAFLGVLRKRNEINTLRSVTGAIKDSIGGTIYAVG